MGWLIFAIFLYFVCAALLVAEVFVPSGGLLSVLALLSLAGGVAIFFGQNAALGWTGIAIAIVMIPVVLISAYKMLPRTKFGQEVTLVPAERSPGQGVPDSAVLKEMEGDTGVALTDLRPVGMCEINGRKVECVSQTGYIEKDSQVKVVKVESSQVTVRRTEIESTES
jgi:membrane-bound serine protease (ClpP class)